MEIPAISFIEPTVKDLAKDKYPVFANRRHIEAGIAWLSYAQDVTKDGGVSAYYSLTKGWASSFVETTGYIIETFIDASDYLHDTALIERAKRMGNFLIDNQNEDGSFKSNSPTKKPIIFDTGQDLLGLVSLYKKTRDKQYLAGAKKAGEFLVRNQGKNGNWVRFSYGGRGSAYQNRVALALLKLYELVKDEKIMNAAVKNLDWSISKQNKNGWFEDNNFPPPNPSEPYTHTIAYATEGLLWSYKILKTREYLLAAKTTADSVLNVYEKKKYLPGTLDENWLSNNGYSCLVGDAQFSIIWQQLYRLTKSVRYKTASHKMNNYLKSLQMIRGKNKYILGGIKGSDPIYGDILTGKGYSRMAYLNWATKFFVDALIMEEVSNN